MSPTSEKRSKKRSEKESTTDAAALTVERIFSSPALTGTPPTDLRFSPDDSFVTFRAPAADDRERYDLYKIDLVSAQQSHWVDARDITSVSTDVTALTDTERAERERRRDFSHGITHYLWRPAHDDELLLPLNGQAYLLTVPLGTTEPRALCPTNSRQSHFKFSPDGRWLAYVRDRDLFILEVDSQIEYQLTRTDQPTLSYGLADFLAAEEMHRFDGYWWSLASDGIFYTAVDDSEVAPSHRLEIDANGAQSFVQRYPFAGHTNPQVTLFFQPLDAQFAGPQQTLPDNALCLWSSPLAPTISEDIYLARVIPLSHGLLIQVQDRRQQSLRYLYQVANESPNPYATSRWAELYTESSDTWVNLSDDTHEFDAQGIILTEESNGTRQLKIVAWDGTERTLPGPTHINRVIKRVGQHIYVCGWHTTPLENHLFALSIDGTPWRQVSTEPGWHEVTFNHQGTGYLDRFTDPTTLLKVSFHSLEPFTDTILHEERIDQNHPYAPYQTQHAKPSFGEFAAADGQNIHYRLTPPTKVVDQHPVILYVYGGPGAQKVRHDWGTLTVQLFAHHGFGVLEIDNRGSANRGREFEAPLYRHLGGVEVEDQVLGLSVLTDIDWADTERIGVFGHSYGGYMTLMCLGQQPTMFAAGVAVAPVCDWLLYDSHYTERFMGLPDENAEGYQQGNVLTHLKKITAPLLLMHGMADDNVLFQNSTMIMNRLQELGKPFELMTYPGAKHSMQEPHVAKHRFTQILNFFKKELDA